MKKKDTSLKPRNSGTWIRTIIMVLVFLNQVTALAGKLTFFSEGVWGTVYLLISVVLTFITMLLVYWYNNDWTGAASLATDFFNMISDEIRNAYNSFESCASAQMLIKKERKK